MSAEQDREPALSRASMQAGAVFLSYASEDAAAAERIASALRAAGIEVWFDKSELRGGDAWDREIRQQIHDCALFIPVISAHSDARHEGYFRREWRLAVERAGDMSERVAFLVPVVIDDTSDSRADVPDRFREVQWTRLPGGETPSPFIERVRRLLSPEAPTTRSTTTTAPSGLTTVQASRKTVPPPSASKLALWTMSAVLAVAVLYLVVDRFWLSKRTAAATAPTASASSTAPEKSIAVLPFVDLSEKHDQEYFADGLAEEILNQLVKLPGLKVIGRTSSFQFKGRSEDLRRVGVTLQAGFIVEGSVRKAGERIRVTAQLISAADGSHRWSETYDRDVVDILQVQSEIATRIGRALAVEVIPDFIRSTTAIRNLDSYDSYLRGLHAFDRGDESGTNEAIADFQRALALDPAFTPAATALALAYAYQGDENFAPPREAFENARLAAKAVVRLEPNSAEAHAALALVHVEYDWDWQAARKEVDESLRLAPDNLYVLVIAAQERIAIGDWNEALRHLDAALSLSPLDFGALNFRSITLQRLGRLKEAEAARRKILELSPEAEWTHYFLGQIAMQRGDPRSAVAEFIRETDRSPREAGLVAAYAALGDTHNAMLAFNRLREEGAENWPFAFVVAHAALGQLDGAFEWLNKTYEAKDSTLWLIKGHPFLKPLEKDQRYQAFLRRMNLPE